ncbi:MAG: DUF2007 domain-containing protein [Clostridia bacterium]|nr:DUF2007 domain-containing protein [Clostridia bacterium]
MDFLFGLDKPRRADEGMALLTTTHDNIELSILQSILEGESIPFACYDRGSGGAMRVIAGYSFMGTDIFVPEALLEQATELLDAYRNGEEITDEEAEALLREEEE